jgi:very-short-patch-repair endonuclease/Arc/MetJ-type ribon-helix-helix transcriptional regulator
MTHPDEALSALAGAQRTIVSHEQLLTLGYGRRTIAHWVNRGRLQPDFHGVYSVVSGKLPPLGREQAALLAVGERAFLSHETAAAVWGLVRALPRVVEVTVVGRYRSSSDGIRVHRVKTLDRRELRRHEDLWVSSPARAVLEIAANASANELAGAIDQGLSDRRFTSRELADVLARHRPCRGAARLGTILGDPTATAVSRSKREKALLKLIRDAGLPMPETNVPFGRFELDFFWRREGLVVEIDGYNFHRGPGAFGRDREKELAVRTAGLAMLRFTGDHVLKRPWMVLATIAGELARLGSAG